MKQQIFKKAPVLLLAIAFLAIPSASQTTEELEQKKREELQQLKDNGYFEGYFKPIFSTLGVNILTGTWNSAHFERNKFQLYVGLEAHNLWISDKMLLFDTDRIDKTNGEVSTATIFGGKPAVVQDDNNLVSAPYLPGLLPSEGASFPIAFPHIIVGSLFGTGLSARFMYLPDVFSLSEELDLKEEKSIWLLNLGVAHSIDQYLGEKSPLHFNVSFSYGSANFVDAIKVNAFDFGINASKQLAFIDGYAAFGWQIVNGSLNFKVTDKILEDPRLSSNFSFDAGTDEIKAESSPYGNIGLKIKAGLFSIHSVFRISRLMSINGGIGIDI